MTGVEKIKEYGKNLEKFGKLLQNENATIYRLVDAAEACNMNFAIQHVPMYNDSKEEYKITIDMFDFCPHCKCSFSFNKPNSKGICPYCDKNVLAKADL